MLTCLATRATKCFLTTVRRLAGWACCALQAIAEAQARRKQQSAAYMPSRRLLADSGHADLIPLVEAAGGFLEVGSYTGKGQK